MDRHGHSYDVLAVGELNPDLIVSGIAAAGPKLGSEQIFTEQRLTLGSSTAISCTVMQRLGLDCAFASKIGDDEYGRFCLTALKAEGVDCRAVQVSADEPTGVTLSITYPGDRLLLTRCGAIASFCLQDIDMHWLHRVRHVHSGSFYLQRAFSGQIHRLFAQAKAAGVSTSLDPGWDPTEIWCTRALRKALPHVDVLFPNRSELAALGGSDDVSVNLDRLHAMGASMIALKLGAEGSLVSRHGVVITHQGYSTSVVDTTGAGDSFNAGFVRAMLAGHEPADCLRLGNACGALTVAAVGGTGGVVNMDRTLQLMASMGEEPLAVS